MRILKLTNKYIGGVVCAVLFIASICDAHSIKNEINVYSDNQGYVRNRVKLDMDLSAVHYRLPFAKSSYNIIVAKDYFSISDIEENEYIKEFYKDNKWEQDTVSASFTQEWSSLINTNVLASYSTDKVIKSQTLGAGFSHWILHETLQYSVGVSSTNVNRPKYEVLDADSDIISPPTLQKSLGLNLKIKHLSTPTTITEYGINLIQSNERPLTTTYAVGIKQFIPASESALHLNVARALNKGRLTTKTSYGEVDAWIVEGAFLQTMFWSGGYSKIWYRYYKETEITRVEKKEYLRGSDHFGINYAQNIDDNIVDGLEFPITLNVGVSRYLTNELENGKKIVANMYEMGVSAKF